MGCERQFGGPDRRGEQGYMLLAVVVMVALVLIALAVAAPMVAKDIRRDKEVESAHRAQQYVRGLRLYYRKFKSYPPSMEALEKSNNVRFLRKQYVDPLTGKADWRIIHVGENQTTVKGFFGESLGGLDTKGIGSGLSSTGTSINTGCTGVNASFCDAATKTSTSGGTAAPGAPSSTSVSSLGSGGVGQIMGVGSSRTGESILTPNQQTSYDTWEFLYDPKIELLYAKANILGGGISSGAPTSKSLSDLNNLNGPTTQDKPKTPAITPQ